MSKLKISLGIYGMQDFFGGNIKKLVESIETRVAEMDLRVNIKQERECLTELTVYATALAMNYVTRGKFVQT